MILEQLGLFRKSVTMITTEILTRTIIDPSDAELSQISKLYHEWLVHDPCSHCACFGGVQYARDTTWLRDHTAVEGSRLIVAELAGTIVGFAQIFVDDRSFPEFAGDLTGRFAYLGRVAYIYLILVSRSVERHGIGRLLYQRVFEECQISGCDVLVAEVFVCPVPNSRSLAFHEALGFEYSGLTASHERHTEGRIVDLTYTQLIRRL